MSPHIIPITDLDIPELEVYTKRTENELRHLFEPHGGAFIAESPKVILRALDAGCRPISFLMEDRQLDDEVRAIIARAGNVPIYTAGAEILKKLTGFPMTRGALAAMHRPTLPTVESICGTASRIVILEQVVNPTNVGAIFRSAAALGIDAVLLTPGCSDPLYRRAARVSMGTVFQIPWSVISPWPGSGLLRLKDLGFKTAAMALRSDSLPIDDAGLLREERLALILGTEGDGLAAHTIASCDYCVKIPMSHGVDSLNVSAAAAVAFWQIARAAG